MGFMSVMDSELSIRCAKDTSPLSKRVKGLPVWGWLYPAADSAALFVLEGQLLCPSVPGMALFHQ